jgi:hypothetical protein
MAKNPFKKQSIIDTVVNVGIGGAANVAIDYVVDQVDALKSLGGTTINALKIAAGAVVGSMVTDKFARAAADGVATVGVSNLIAGLMAGEETPAPANGLPYGTISGRVIPGNRAYRRARKVSGTPTAGVMGK